jgi:hypothetical protein
MSQAKTTALIAGVGAIIVGAGYAAYNIADKGLIWTKDAQLRLIFYCVLRNYERR